MKLKNILIALVLITLSISCTGPCFAHSGGTDGDGGHRGDGGYHYHHGYPAHQHTDGVCPYDFDDNTDARDSADADSRSNSVLYWYLGIVAATFVIPFIVVGCKNLYKKINKM